MDELDQLAENAKSDVAVEVRYRAALKRFAKRLPYDDNVRQQQTKLWALHQRLLKAEDAAEAVVIMDEMRVIRASLQKDPNVALTERVLRQRFMAGLDAKNAEAPARVPTPIPNGSRSTVGTWSVFLPGVASGLLPDPVDPTEPCAPYLPAGNGSANFNLLTRGDLLFLSLNHSINNYYYAMKFSHNGMYNGTTDGGQRVYESNPENQAAGIPNGVNLLLIDRWLGQGACVSLMRENIAGISQTNVQAALDWAQARYGVNGETGYNFNLLQKVEDRAPEGEDTFLLYYSQLIWHIFNHLNVDVDSNDAAYTDWLVGQYPPALADTVRDFADTSVAPDESARSNALRRLSEGVNP